MTDFSILFIFKFIQYLNDNIANFVHFGKTLYCCCKSVKGSGKHLLPAADLVISQAQTTEICKLQCNFLAKPTTGKCKDMNIHIVTKTVQWSKFRTDYANFIVIHYWHLYTSNGNK